MRLSIDDVVVAVGITVGGGLLGLLWFYHIGAYVGLALGALIAYFNFKNEHRN